MTDPTPTPTTPAAPARSARETIAEAVKAVEEWAHPYTPAEAALRDGYNTLFRKICGTHAALRALLDAPTGAVEKLVKAARDIDETLRADAMPNGAAHLALVDALAAVRASPEAVGAGAKKCSCAFSEKDDDARCNPAACNCAGCHADEWRGALARVTEERNEAMRQRNAFADRLSAIAKGYGGPFATPEERVEYCERGRETLTSDLKALRAERDALKADLAEARKLLLDANADWSRKVGALMTQRDSLKADLDKARGEVMRLRADRDRAGMPTTVNGSTPPPATEAVASRARLLYDGAMHYIATTAAAGLQDGPEDCARIARRVLEECEKAGKGEGGKA